MAYTKVNWQAGVTPLSEANMDHLETQYDEGATDLAAKKLDDLATPDDNADLNSTTTEHGLLKKLDNDATHFMNGQGAWSSTAVLTFDTSTVYNANAPVGWTDLSLAGVIGANQAIVLLKILNNNTGAARQYGLRRNGSGHEFYNVANKHLTQISLENNFHGYTIVVTDAAGIIEWICSAAVATLIIMEAYII